MAAAGKHVIVLTAPSLYHAISIVLHGNASHHSEIRNDVMKHHSSFTKKSGEREIAAVCHVFKRQIHVYDLTNDGMFEPLLLLLCLTCLTRCFSTLESTTEPFVHGAIQKGIPLRLLFDGQSYHAILNQGQVFDIVQNRKKITAATKTPTQKLIKHYYEHMQKVPTLHDLGYSFNGNEN